MDTYKRAGLTAQVPVIKPAQIHKNETLSK
jgi:hypothetical protein